MDILTTIQEMLNPALLPLVVVLYLIGLGIKRMEKIEDKYIPLILGAVSIIMVAIYTYSTTTMESSTEIAGAILAILMQGILYAGAAVYSDQIYKQLTTKG